MTNSVESWFNSLSQEEKIPLTELRQLIKDSNGNITEEIKWSRPCYSLNHLICYLHKSSKHVTIGFQRGVQLDDPDSLLEGQGKDMRHVKIGFAEKIDTPAIRKLIESAIALDKK